MLSLNSQSKALAVSLPTYSGVFLQGGLRGLGGERLWLGFFIPLKLKRGFCPPTFGGYSGTDAYKRHTHILRTCARTVWDNKEQKQAGMCVLGVPQVVQVSRRETWRKRRDLVCSLPKDNFRALTLSALLCFNTVCLLKKAKLSFPKRHSVLQVLVHNSDHIRKVLK